MSSRVRVYSIDELDVALEKVRPPNLVASGTCTTTTPGFTDVQLEARIYVEPPTDGIQELELMATPPAGPVPQVLHPGVPFNGRFDSIPTWCKGIRVIAATNKLEWRL